MQTSYKRQQGHAALLFTMIVPVLFGIFALATDGVRALQSKARLGDAAEVAILTIAARNADNSDVNPDIAGSGSQVNRDIAKSVISNYFYNQDSILLQDLKISKLACNDIPECREGLTRGENRFNEYRIEAKTRLNTWFPGNESIVGFGDTFTVGHAAKARKYVNKTVDVVFVADFSESMNRHWNGRIKIDALKNVMGNIVKEIEKFDAITDGNNTVGVVPFNWYTAEKSRNRVANFNYYADWTIRNLWRKGKYTEKPPGDKSYFFDIPLTNNYKQFISQFNRFRANHGTASYEGVIRGAQMLKTGKNPRRLLIVLSDGQDSGADQGQIKDVQHRELNDRHYCQIIKQRLSEDQNENGENYAAKLAVIGFGYDLENNVELARCVGVDNVYKAENEQEILDRILELISEEIGHLK
ncbi:Protein TadG, associated with Flp pilus assembly [Moritella sp. JT01]|uniref:TadE/TadG family type IV pilus assembly protein n=1 Tax=Moritella sp. JT01 TaxID=756698 RepID=UPI000793CE55|nr:TadE/TadG family type IV pilus assembly protein [Moritella sp. JT01]KXO09529.1 Protein TadG, associated with Flp pilus assembly [Moritella sp. JT01]